MKKLIPLLALLLFASPAWGAFALISNTHIASFGGGDVTTGSIDTTGANLLVVSVSWAYSAENPTVSDSKGNTWTAATLHSTSGMASRIYYAIPSSVGSGHTFTAAFGGGRYPSLQVTAWSGAHASPWDSQENGASASTASTLSTGSVTPSENNELVIAAMGYQDNSAGAISINGSFTISNTTTFNSGESEGGSQAYLIQTTATAANPQWNLTNSTQLIAASIATFKSAAGGGGAAVRRRITVNQ